MSANEARELRIDYNDIVAGKLVIVIQGLPVNAPAKETSVVEPPQLPRPVPHAHGGSAELAPLAAEADAIGKAIGETTGYVPALLAPLLMASWRGQEVLALELIDATLDPIATAGAAPSIALTEYAKAVLYNGLGRYLESCAAAQRAFRNDAGAVTGWVENELVEAAARSNSPEVAREAFRRLDECQSTEGRDWILGLRTRSAALLSDDHGAERLYHQAIERLAESGLALQAARAQLVYGEWLRRRNRRLDARVQLRAAHRTFGNLDASGFAQRACRELLATGETARKRVDEARDVLTPQEAHIAQLACEGLSNPEIGARLYISPRTVQYHLRKVFRKLGVSSRNQLCRIPPSRLEL
jgi:DNA-binding CsgD family transcriptional regulator